MEKELILTDELIKDKIHTIRGVQVILDSDIARLYEVSTKALNQSVKRNKERFPEDFMFQLTKKEFEILRSQIVTSSWGGVRKLPFAFTEHGISILAGILKSKKAIEVNINIIRAFIAMRKFLSKKNSFFDKFERIDQKFIEHDENFEKVFKALEKNELPRQGIFFDGQVFDAHKFVSELISKAKKEIVLIDNYVDYNTLSLFSECKADVTIYTKITEKLKFDIEKFNSQYKPIKVIDFNKSHDRFLIIDKEIYHFGASLKDLGRKWFAFSKMDKKFIEIINKISE